MSKKRTRSNARKRQAAARARRAQAGLAERMLDPETEYRATMLAAGLSTEPRPVEVLLVASTAQRAVITVITDGRPVSTTAAWAGPEIEVGDAEVEADLHELLDTGTEASIVVAALPEQPGQQTRLMGWDIGPDGVRPLSGAQVRELTSTDPRTGELLPPEPDTRCVDSPRIAFHYR